MAKANSAAKLALQMQQIASNAQIEVQRIANEATTKSFDYNAREAATSRDWQKMMSDTSHQREVEDLKKAGLNPVLSSCGQGAQSYTTSSASAQASDASSAVANLASSRMGAAAQGYAAHESAQATRAAAAQSAAATRYAAAQQAAAARYAAAMQYQTQKDSWKWKTDYMKSEYKERTKYANSTPVKSVSGLIDKLTQRAGLQDAIVTSKSTKGLVNFAKNALNNPTSFFKDNVKVTKNNFMNNMTKQGKQMFNVQLKQLGIKPTKKNRKLLGRYLLFSDLGSMNSLIQAMPHRSNSSVPRTYGITLR